MQLAVYTAILTGLCWGIATFAGGRAARDVSPPLLTAIYNVVAGIVFAILFATSSEPSKLDNIDAVPGNIFAQTLFWGILGGVAFAVGLTAITFGISRGRAAVVGPIASTMEVLLPFGYALVVRDLPNDIAVIGILMLFFVPWLVTRTRAKDAQYHTKLSRDVLIGILSGVGFGSYYLALIIGPESTPLLTMMVVQVTSAIVMLGVHIYRRRPWRIPSAHLTTAAIFVIFETLGALTLRHAISNGSPSVVATLAAIIYVASLLLLSFIIAKERFSRTQIFGFILTFTGVALVVLNS